VERIYPGKIQAGDEVQVIAPSRSMSIISPEVRQIAERRLGELGLKLSFGEHVGESDSFASSSIASRVADIHAAFSDPKVKAILTVIGGFNSNQLFDYLDWELIKNNPKILCGFSDITALNNAIYAKTGLVSYSGPHYSSFGQEQGFDYTLEYFKKCLMSEAEFGVEPSQQWSDDAWYRNQANRKFLDNPGWVVINPGEAQGTLLGGNICTLNLLQGTKYMPSLEGAILFLEDDEESQAHHFDRDLQSLIHQPGFGGVRGIVIGRFQQASKITNDLLTQIIRSKQELANLPVIANVDFGHTDPKITFPVGGEVVIRSDRSGSQIVILEH